MQFLRRGKGNYAYTNARAKGKKSRLLAEEDYNKMLMMSVPEIAKYISDAGYSKEMEALGNRYEGLSLIEYATYANMAVNLRSLFNASSGELKTMIQAALSEWDFRNFITILRGKKYGLDTEEIREDLVSAGKMDMKTLDELISMPGVDEAVALFTTKTGMKISGSAVAAYKDEGMLKNIEDELVKTHYKSLLDSIDGNSQPKKIYRNFVRRMIDAQNAETLLKLKLEGIGEDEAVKYFIPGGREIGEKEYRRIASAPDVVSAGSEMQGTKIYDEIKEAVTEDSTGMGIANALNKYRAGLAEQVSNLYPNSVIPVVDYMIHKKNEVRNIRMIAYGVSNGLRPETMKELLVI